MIGSILLRSYTSKFGWWYIRQSFLTWTVKLEWQLSKWTHLNAWKKAYNIKLTESYEIKNKCNALKTKKNCSAQP